MKNIIHIVIVSTMLYACSNSTRDQFGAIDTNGYTVETIPVNYKETIQLTDTSEYEIVDCMSLQLPPEIPTLYTTLIMRNKDRIYILDKNINKTVLVFNDKG